MPRLVGRLMTFAAWFVAGGAAAVIGLQFAGGRVGRYLTPLQALTPWAIPVVIVTAVAALVLGLHGGALANAAVGLAYLALIFPLVFSSPLPRPGDADRLTIVHANMLYSNQRVDDAIAALAGRDADVIALSELTPEIAAAVADSSIGDSHLYTLLRPGSAAVGLGIWSRSPIVRVEPVEGTSMTLAVTIELEGRPMRIVLTHPLPPLFNEAHWQTEMAALAAVPPDDTATTALVGDVNVSYFHPPYRQFLALTGNSDVHHAFGHGLSFSWPTDERVPPFVRLDHALVGDEVTATSIEDFEVPGSDHRAFEVTVAWR